MQSEREASAADDTVEPALSAHSPTPRYDFTIIVPTYNEAGNIAELVSRINAALTGETVEIIFVDDSRDNTPDVIRDAAQSSTVPITLIHRERAIGGLSGAVIEGMRAAQSPWAIVMDGDLQHPPEVIPDVIAQVRNGNAEIVIASRYADGGTNTGLANWIRHGLSRSSTLLTKAMFPLRLRHCSDPMTGFFAVDLHRVKIDELQPRGFKILLETLVRRQRHVAEVPFNFGRRFAGSSKASLRQGWWFVWQLTLLRFGRMSGFAAIGAAGALLNIAIVWLLVSAGIYFLIAAIVAAELTMISNFILQDRLVFRDLAPAASRWYMRFLKSFTFNNAESAIRIAFVYWLVDAGVLTAVVATAVTLFIAFIIRFVFHSLVVYAPKRAA